MTTLTMQTVGGFRRKRLTALAVPGLVLLYLTYIFFAFDVPGLADRVSITNANTLVSDTYSYKTHVTRDNRDGSVEVSIEGERKGRYAQGTAPDWVALGDTTVIDLGDGHIVTFGENVTYDVPGYGLIVTNPGSGGVNAELPDGPVPDWINASRNRLAITTDAGRLSVTRNRSEVFRYTVGWELFFFTLDSPYHDLSWSQIAGRAVNGEAGAIWQDFWTNRMWRHGDVAWALVETILMAFLGTFGAAIIALPLAFLAAKNFTPLGSLRFAARRVFDFLRGVDGLIWTIVFKPRIRPRPADRLHPRSC